MHITLHLTNDCNMNCKYCYVGRQNIKTMSQGTAKAAVDMASGLTPTDGSTGIIFFGGEPLLYKQLIYDTIAHAESIEDATGKCFHFKITTNGLLLDDAFVDYAKKHSLFIALSLDGSAAAHDMHRVDLAGMGTSGRVEANAKKLLLQFPYAPVMMTVNPDTAPLYCDSVKYLYNLGFRYIICSLNYAAAWAEPDIVVLGKQYRKLADFYYELTMREEKFYLSPFEVKISSHIHKRTYCHERCELGKKQISVGPNGLLYPCVQFVGDGSFSIGSVSDGIDEARRETLYSHNEQEKETCVDCAIKSRCNHYCGCLNRQATGSIERVSPALCAHERLLLPIADKLAEKLYKKRSAMFIQKQYNDFYPIVSLVEDRLKVSNPYSDS
jgi:uncharacterized protein